MSDALYLYGFVPTDAPTPPETVLGVDDRRVRIVALERFGAAVSEVDERRYGPDRLEERLKDLPWVGRQGAAHETVVTWFADHATIVPARLFTMFSSTDALRREAGRTAEGVARQLVRFEDLREWDLKVRYEPETLADHLGRHSPDVALADAEIREAAPGRRYLLERRREDLVARESAAVARRLGRELLEELSSLAEESRDLPLPERRDDLRVVLSAAMLVPVRRADELRARAEARRETLGREGVHVELTGPWAPYRFLEEDAR